MPTFPVLFENDEILLLNKPSGVSVQGGKGIFYPLDETLSKQVGYKVHLVHRLDKDTSGLLIVAKNPPAAAKWTTLIASKQVTKEYTAVCFGLPQKNDRPFLRGELEGTIVAHQREQRALLHLTVTRTGILQADGGEAVHVSSIIVRLGTGRMHQIRIQLAKAGCPIIADDKHGDFSLNKKVRHLGLKKLCLAATKLSLPLEGKTREFCAPLEAHIQKALDAMKPNEP